MRAMSGSADGDEAELLSVSDAWAEAIVSNDADRIAAFMADDWVIVSDTGISVREDFLAVVRSGDLTHTAMDRVSAARIRVYGDAAVVTGRVTNTAHHKGRRYDADEWTTDVFVRRDGRWLCVVSQITTASPA
jgi:ketosteroid isomerase-like protein